MGGGVTVRILGPVEVMGADGWFRPTTPRQCSVLGLLALRAGDVVPSAELAGAAWDGEPGPGHDGIQFLLARLRRSLTRARAGDLSQSGDGYRLEAEPDQVDVHRFRRLAREARDAAEPASAVAALDEALGLWRGPALAGVAETGWARQTRLALADERLAAVEDRAEGLLRCGRHLEVAAELPGWLLADPLRERLAGLLIVAMYRCGREPDGLAVFDALRRRLSDEKGVEPGPEFQELRHRMLTADPGPAAIPGAGEPVTVSRPPEPGAGEAGIGELVVPSPGAGEPVTAALAAGPAADPGLAQVVPSQLPPSARYFTGRQAELDALSRLLGESAGAAGTVVVSAIGGMAGVGKSALAVHWARQHAADFPDGQLYVNLRGFGPNDPLPPAEALRSFLDAMGVPAAQIPAGLDGLQALFRSLLAGKRMLILLDNARDPDQVRPLLPGTPTALVLVTSRSELSSLVVADGARQVSLDVLTVAEARQLLARRLGAARVAAEPQAVAEVIRLCARLPLALAITAARAAAYPQLSLTALAARLRDAGRLDVLSTGEDATDVRAVFSWSCQGLSTRAARMFRLLGLHPGPDITATAAASLAGLEVAEARRALRELARCHLLAEPYPGRYAFHDLLRAYAAEKAARTDSDQDRRAAVHRMLDHYLHTAHAATLLLNPPREPIALTAPQPGASPEHLAVHQQARDWFAAEHQVLLAMAGLAAGSGFDVHAWQLPWALSTFLDGRGQWHEQAAVQRAALEAATRLGDKAGQAVISRLLAHNCARLGEYDQARAYLADCPALYQELGDRAGEARVQRSLGWVAELQGWYADALQHGKQALTLFRAVGHQVGEAGALNAVGWDCALLGEYQQARTFCRQALELYRELGNHRGEAITWDSLGYAEHHLGQYADAAACYCRAISMLRDLGDRLLEASVLTRLGETQHAAGDPGGARDAWQQALAILDDLHHPDAAGLRDKLGDLGSVGLAKLACLRRT